MSKVKQIQDKVFFHISRKGRFETDTVGQAFNPFYKDFNNFDFKNVPFNISNLPCLIPQKVSVDVVQLLKEVQNGVHSIIREYSMYVRERLFDDVRLKVDPDAPSRLKCLWLIPIDRLLPQRMSYWNNEITSDTQNTAKVIYKLSCTGNVFEADSSFIDLVSNAGRLGQVRELAERYWSGERYGTEQWEKQEVLFEGKVKVLDSYQDISEVDFSKEISTF